jgi:hypothetical protein
MQCLQSECNMPHLAEHRWTAATKASNRETQADVVFELAELTQDDSISGEHFAQVRVAQH